MACHPSMEDTCEPPCLRDATWHGSSGAVSALTCSGTKVMLPAHLLLSQSLGLLVCLRWRPFGPAQGAMPSMPRAGPACNGAGPQRDRPVRPSNTTRSEEHTSELQSLM